MGAPLIVGEHHETARHHEEFLHRQLLDNFLMKNKIRDLTYCSV